MDAYDDQVELCPGELRVFAFELDADGPHLLWREALITNSSIILIDLDSNTSVRHNRNGRSTDAVGLTIP